jgi:hypothetical protein
LGNAKAVQRPTELSNNFWRNSSLLSSSYRQKINDSKCKKNNLFVRIQVILVWTPPKGIFFLHLFQILFYKNLSSRKILMYWI